MSLTCAYYQVSPFSFNTLNSKAYYTVVSGINKFGKQLSYWERRNCDRCIMNKTMCSFFEIWRLFYSTASCMSMKGLKICRIVLLIDIYFLQYLYRSIFKALHNKIHITLIIRTLKNKNNTLFSFLIFRFVNLPKSNNHAVS